MPESEDEVGRKAEQLYSDHKEIQKPIDAAQAELVEGRDLSGEGADEAAMEKVGNARIEAKPQFAANQAAAVEFARKNLEALQTGAAEDMKAERNGEGPDLRPKPESVPDKEDEQVA